MGGKTVYNGHIRSFSTSDNLSPARARLLRAPAQSLATSSRKKKHRDMFTSTESMENFAALPRDAMHKRGLGRHAVSVRP